MGFASEHVGPIIFDLESVAHERAAEFLPPPDLDTLDPPKNYTNPETIAKWKDEEKTRRVKQWNDDLSRCALDPDLNRIVAIGWSDSREPERLLDVVVADDEASERVALQTFWQHVPPGTTLMGFNIVGFDMPTLLRRSRMLGVKAPAFSLGRYRHPFIVDLQKLLLFDGVLTTWRKQSFYIKRFGLDVPEDPHTGADIAQLFAEKNWLAIENHVRCDVLGARAIAEFLGVIDARKYSEVL